MRARRARAPDTPTPPPTPPPPGSPPPGADGLAEPTLPANPSQADVGAQGFWLHCMPCHGDRGQGLTADFREQYPLEDQNCWASGCHGARPYEDGFTLPATIPAIIGTTALSRFPDAGALFAFVRGAMPWHDPGSLDEETYWQIVAYLVRENARLPAGVTLGPESAGAVGLASGGETLVATESPAAGSASNREVAWGVVVLVGAAALLAAAGVLGWLSREGRHAAPPN